MTKKEALKKIKELEDYIQELDDKVGFEDDELFLLSAEEYEKYKGAIPMVDCWWWLRSPGDISYRAAGVNSDGSFHYIGRNVYNDSRAVRPALKCDWSTPYKRCFRIGERIIKYDFPFICIDEATQLLIAEVPIGFHRFDAKSNDYKSSEIRQWLKDWARDRG